MTTLTFYYKDEPEEVALFRFNEQNQLVKGYDGGQ